MSAIITRKRRYSLERFKARAAHPQIRRTALLQLSQQLFHHFPAYISQPIVAALEAVGQLEVVQAEQVENRRVQIVDVNFFLDRVKTEFVGRAQDNAGFDAAAGQPNREAMRVMVAAQLV